MTLAKQICEEFEYDYNSPWRPKSPINVPYNQILKELSKERTLDDEKSENVGNLFRNGEPFSNQEGYIIGYQFGRWVTDNTEHGIHDLTGFGREEREDLVNKVLSQLYK